MNDIVSTPRRIPLPLKLAYTAFMAVTAWASRAGGGMRDRARIGGRTAAPAARAARAEGSTTPTSRSSLRTRVTPM